MPGHSNSHMSFLLSSLVAGLITFGNFSLTEAAEPASGSAEIVAIEDAIKRGSPPAPLIEQARKVVERDPTNVRAHFLLAQTLQNAGMYELAVDAFKSARTIDESVAQQRLQKFKSIMDGPDLEPAMKYYLEMSTNFPTDPSVLQLQSLLKKRWGKVENAWEWYLQALAHGKRLKGINATRGWDLYTTRDFAGALKYAEADIAIDPMDPEFLALQGRALLNMHQYSSARAPLQKAFRRGPYEFNVARDLTKVYIECGMKGPALKTSLFYLTVKPKDREVQEQVAGLIKENSLATCDAAVLEAQKYAQQSNRGGDFHVGYANVLKLSGDGRGALQQLKEAVQDDPRNVMAQLAYAFEAQRYGQYQEALTAYDQAVLYDRENKNIQVMRERVRVRMINQSNDVASQLRSALRMGRRPAAPRKPGATSP